MEISFLGSGPDPGYASYARPGSTHLPSAAEGAPALATSLLSVGPSPPIEHGANPVSPRLAARGHVKVPTCGQRKFPPLLPCGRTSWLGGTALGTRRLHHRIRRDGPRRPGLSTATLATPGPAS